MSVAAARAGAAGTGSPGAPAIAWPWPAMPVLATGTLGLAAFAALYVATVLLGRTLGVPPMRFPLFWPAGGLLLAVLAVNRPTRWPALVLVSALAGAAANLAYGSYRGYSLPVYAANLLGIAPAAWVVRRFGGEERSSLRFAGALVLAAVFVAGPLSGAAAVGVLLTLDIASPHTPFVSAFHWWTGIAAGLLVTAPAALVLTHPAEPRRCGPLEVVGAWAALGGASALLFLSPPRSYLPGIILIPPILWVAVRLGSRATAAAVLALALAGSWATVHGMGRFAYPSPLEQVFSLRLFLVVLGSAAVILAAAMDERQRARERLELLATAVSRAPDALALHAPDGSPLWVNDAMAHLLGLSAGEIVGRPVGEVAAWLAREGWLERVGRLGAEESLVAERLVPLPRGGAAPYEVSARRVEVEGRSYLVSVLRDISDRRRAEAALRVAGIGTLAAGLAHEINNPLSFVSGNLEYLRQELQAIPGRAPSLSPEELAAPLEALADAEVGARRVRDLVRDLQLFTREEPGTRPVHVQASVRSALAITRNELRHRARLAVDLPDGLPPVLGNEQRLVQVFVNLLANAAQALPDEGPGDHEVRVAARSAGGEVVVSVADTGRGIPAEIQERIFEPFFTTRVGAGGTGLGLSICHRIVTDLGGRIEVESASGQGATFRVRLPAIPQGARADADSAPAGAVAPALPRARLLVVDDEERLGALVQRLVGSEHQVTVTASAEEALVRAGDGSAFDAVLCDLMMPEMSGQEFLARLAAQAPALAAKLAFMTGGAFTDSARAFLAGREGPTLQKPFDALALRKVLAALLAPGAGRPPG